MDIYRVINRELSINNQELRNVVNKLKHEITFLNRQLIDQREEFVILKATIAKSLELKYLETMALIYPEKHPVEKQTNKLDLESHRRSCSNMTAADPIKNKSHSPPAGACSSGSDIMNESPLKTSFPRVIVEKSPQLSRSPRNSSPSVPNRSSFKRSGESQKSRNITENEDSSENSDLEQTLKTTNASLHTINEEKSVHEAPNETISDATINCLLDAPCSTPYNHFKFPNETTFQKKKCRVLVQKISNDKLTYFLNNCKTETNNSYTHLSSSRSFKKSSFKTKNEQIDSCHTDMGFSQSKGFSFNLKTNYSPIQLQEKNQALKTAMKPISNNKIKKRSKKRSKQKDKENLDSDSDFTCSDEETTSGRRRLRIKQISLKEPSLRTKLRNTTNIKL